ncbi:hypothetical protein LSH36_4g20032 [Paralvinella palmiformis]|uniref:Uncharacterized protein n=1 Tax=Paralvinella palmiformis TaxID=53620 RepID=A0AAD9NHF1_9ANNE|nr:hypothetical protein LSH36_4g20032 [Paralvinella palmiformis]
MSDWVCTYRQLCKGTPCDMRSSYCEQEKCFPCRGLCTKTRIIDNHRLADCWNICPLYMDQQCDFDVKTTTQVTAIKTNCTHYYNSMIALAIISAVLLLVIMILLQKLKELRRLNQVRDGTQAGTPEDQSFLPNGQQDSSTHFRTQNGIIAHPEGDDSMEVG